MRINIPLNFRVSESKTARRLIPFGVRAWRPAFTAAILLALLPLSNLMAAQAPATPPASASQPGATQSESTTAQQPVSHRPHRGPTHAPAPKAEAVLAAPPAPVLPKWPANDQPVQPTVVWDSQGLRIDAANSSLQQILNTVSLATGTKVEGLASDERVFGDYGPGTASEVLAQLLQGSSYNVIMIGDRGQGTPREILLTVRQSRGQQPVQNIKSANDNEEDTEVEEQAQPEQPPPPPSPTAPPARPGFAPGEAPRTPQEIMQEMQQRQQQQMQQQQPQPQ